MIEKNEILKMAAGLSLRPETVEKDYILGWMLYGINKHDAIKHWSFKGGTSTTWRPPSFAGEAFIV
jgi:predicted nucleotidyltransferase component of viral defense system